MALTGEIKVGTKLIKITHKGAERAYTVTKITKTGRITSIDPDGIRWTWGEKYIRTEGIIVRIAND